jgi:phage shock protein PspC (stress-responsive transcriptional regulator)
METIHQKFRKHGLVRARDGRVLGGVIAGIGRRLGIDPWPARLLFVAALLIVPGSQFLVYPALWILMPDERPAWTAVT